MGLEWNPVRCCRGRGWNRGELLAGAGEMAEGKGGNRAKRPERGRKTKANSLDIKRGKPKHAQMCHLEPLLYFVKM